MKKLLTIWLCFFAASVCWADMMATQNWVSNRMSAVATAVPTGGVTRLYTGSGTLLITDLQADTAKALAPGSDSNALASAVAHTTNTAIHLTPAQAIALATALQPPATNAFVRVTGGTSTNLDLYSDWQTFSGVTGSFALTNLADRPAQITGTGAVALAFSGLKPPTPIYLVLGGFESVSWPSNTYAVGGWGAWQTNRMNHFAVWQVSTNLFVNQITTSDTAP